MKQNGSYRSRLCRCLVAGSLTGLVLLAMAGAARADDGFAPSPPSFALNLGDGPASASSDTVRFRLPGSDGEPGQTVLLHLFRAGEDEAVSRGGVGIEAAPGVMITSQGRIGDNGKSVSAGLGLRFSF